MECFKEGPRLDLPKHPLNPPSLLEGLLGSL